MTTEVQLELDESIKRRFGTLADDARVLRTAAALEDNGIRALQGYVKGQALAHGVPVIPNHSFDQTIATVIDLVMDKATSQAADLSSDFATTAATQPTPMTQPMTQKEGRPA